MKKAILLLVLFCCPAVAEEPDLRNFSEEAEKTAARLREKIQDEIKTLGKHPWAGRYYMGDGLGMNIVIYLAPKAGYVYEWHGCLGLYDRNYGAVEERDGKLRLSFTLRRDRKSDFGIPDELVPIAWGQRRYLAPAKAIVDFCNSVNDGSEPRRRIHGLTLLRAGDERKKVTGLPDVPKAYRRYLLAKPIETEIVSVGKPITSPGDGDVKEVTIKVVLKHGSKAGLLPGMELHVIEPGNVFDSVKLEKVGERQSEAVITRYQPTGAGILLLLLDKNPEPGWKLSTRSLYRQAAHDHEDLVDDEIERISDAIWRNPSDAQAYRNRGSMYQLESHLEEAIADYTEAIRLDPKDSSAFFRRGTAYQENNDLDKAIADLSEAIRLDSKEPIAYKNRGCVYLKKNDFDKAIADFAEVIQLKPGEFTAYSYRGGAYQQKNDFDKAIADYTKATRLAPDDIPSLNNQAWMLATCTKDAMRNGVKAVELARRANDLCQEENPQVLDTLAAAYAEAGRFPEAVATAKKAIQLATEEKNHSLAARVRTRLALYEANKPFRQTLPPPQH